MMKKLVKLLMVLLMIPSVAYAGQQTEVEGKSEVISSQTYQKRTKKLVSKNKKLKKSITKLQKQIASDQQFVDEHSNQKTQQADNTNLANLDYNGTQEIIVNNNDPNFSQEDLSTVNGAWQKYGDLDNLNRVTAANALLNVSLMPSAKREPLHWNPTGWHNKRISGGWLYNRSHLIGYQLTGQNNNPKNLMTGTRSLNSPEMLAHEMDIAYYLKQSSSHYIRYRVTPVFRGNELLPRGVQMEAQSVGDNSVHFNVYIFNVQDGVTLNYNDGTSQIG
ncbi:DNA/RNA non-specific endonuclease [Companilactobacillus farciminis]|uniref:DNA/RNA non-specific endonuclease n=1 Tax=Companilactobacillus farciminis TaxID=1612 RepID=UPI0023307E18|nr:DNA/RNA non-specific endonuclease [Companilactobacillus farciminis]WCG35695.1 DNA/RNA non-specific endonuclease [Companilactobacillus farciminis]